jgi:hypothetical protein
MNNVLKDMPVVTVEQIVRFREHALLIEQQRNNILVAARDYAARYLQDEAESEEDCTCGEDQHIRAKRLFEVIAEIEATQ